MASNEQIIAASIATFGAMIMAGILFYIYLRKEKAVQRKMVAGEIILEDYKDYDLIMISGKQLKEFKEKVLKNEVRTG